MSAEIGLGGELSVLLLTILLPFFKEQEAHAEKTYRRPTQKIKLADKQEAVKAKFQTNTTYFKQR